MAFSSHPKLLRLLDRSDRKFENVSEVAVAEDSRELLSLKTAYIFRRPLF